MSFHYCCATFYRSHKKKNTFIAGLHGLNYSPVGKDEQRIWWERQFVKVEIRKVS